MNEYTDAASRPGKRLGGADDRELFLIEFGDLVMQAWEETNSYEGLTYTRNITQGKADTFPIIGRKRDAKEHTPGDLILGGTMEHNDVEITLDRMVVDSIFVPEVDEIAITLPPPCSCITAAACLVQSAVPTTFSSRQNFHASAPIVINAPG